MKTRPKRQSPPGVLAPEQIENQARALRAFIARGGDPERWITSKDFWPADEARIRQAAKRRYR